MWNYSWGMTGHKTTFYLEVRQENAKEFAFYTGTEDGCVSYLAYGTE
jgi:hypothetical protein